MTVYLKNTYAMTKGGIRIEKEIWIAGMPETVAVSECEKMYHQMDELAKEVRKGFD